MPKETNRVTIPKDIWDSLTYFVNEEKQKLSAEIRDSMTNREVINEILKNHLTKVGHYPVKTVEEPKQE